MHSWMPGYTVYISCKNLDPHCVSWLQHSAIVGVLHRACCFPGSTRATLAMASGRRLVRTSKALMLVAVVLVGLVMQSPAPCSALGPPAGMIRVHHYTDEAGYLGIKESGYIRPSRSIRHGNACHGDGVYVTELNVSTPCYEILSNNYKLDGGIDDVRNNNQADRADYVFIFDVDPSSVKFIGNAKGVSILIFGGGDTVPVENAIYSGKTDDVFERIKGVQKILEEPEIASLKAAATTNRLQAIRPIGFSALLSCTYLLYVVYFNRCDPWHYVSDNEAVFVAVLILVWAAAFACLVLSSID